MLVPFGMRIQPQERRHVTRLHPFKMDYHSILEHKSPIKTNKAFVQPNTHSTIPPSYTITLVSHVYQIYETKEITEILSITMALRICSPYAFTRS